MTERIRRFISLSNILNLVLILFVAMFFVQRAPGILRMFAFQGKTAPAVRVAGLRGNAFSLPLKGKHAVVFWATWCAPCKVELARINKLVIDQKIKPDAVLAISIGEDARLVAETVDLRGYRFDVAVDPKAEAAKAYEVNATPTVVLVDEDARVNWMTAGLSPTLELRLNSFLNSSDTAK